MQLFAKLIYNFSLISFSKYNLLRQCFKKIALWFKRKNDDVI